MRGSDDGGDSSLRGVAVQMIQALKDTPADTAGKWASIIATLCAGKTGAGILGTSGGTTKHQADDELPVWARTGVDKRSALHWDTSQTVANCTVNGAAVLAIVDSGSYKTIMDVGMAKMLGLKVRSAIGGDCGTYSVPGTG